MEINRMMIIFVGVILCLRILMAGLFIAKVSEICEARNEDIKIGGLAFIMILFFGVLGMIASAILCNAIPVKTKQF